MTLAVMQPYFFPYSGYFSLIHSCDKFVFFDNVQFTRKSWMSRNRLLNVQKGEPFYFRPDLEKTPYQALLPTVKLKKGNDWKTRIVEQVKTYKEKAPFYDETVLLLQEIFEPEYEDLVTFNIESIKKISKHLNFETVFENFTQNKAEFEVRPNKGTWGLEISKIEQATKYVNSPGGVEFISPEPFSKEGIKLGFLKTNSFSYHQGSSPVDPNLSILDVLFFNGKEEGIKIVADYQIEWKN